VGTQKQQRRRSTALGSKCEQCRVYNRRKRLGTDLFLWYRPSPNSRRGRRPKFAKPINNINKLTFLLTYLPSEVSDTQQHSTDAPRALLPAPLARWTRPVSAPTWSRTRRNQFDASAALASPRRRNDVTSCIGIDRHASIWPTACTYDVTHKTGSTSIATPPEEDRATAIRNTKFKVKIGCIVPGDMLAERQMDRQTHRQTDALITTRRHPYTGDGVTRSSAQLHLTHAKRSS